MIMLATTADQFESAPGDDPALVEPVRQAA
jgi:hypothetical protein